MRSYLHVTCVYHIIISLVFYITNSFKFTFVYAILLSLLSLVLCCHAYLFILARDIQYLNVSFVLYRQLTNLLIVV